MVAGIFFVVGACMCVWVGCSGQVVVGVGIVEEFVGGVGSCGAGPAGAEMFVFVVEFVVRVGGEGVFGLVVVVVEGERGGVLGGGSEAGEGAVAPVVEEVFDGDEGGGEEEEAYRDNSRKLYFSWLFGEMDLQYHDSHTNDSLT